MSHPNEFDIKRLEKAFESPFPDKVKSVVEKTKGGYDLIETRLPWDGSDNPWTRNLVAKIVFVKSSGIWKLYWMRASGKWNLYKELKSLNDVINALKDDVHGCFWG
jgi:hypothetical protein